MRSRWSRTCVAAASSTASRSPREPSTRWSARPVIGSTGDLPPDRGYPRLLNLGAGTLRYEGWVNADEYGFKRALRERSFAPDWMLDITRTWNCPRDYWDGICSQHVIEHLTYSEAVHVFEECWRTLKPGAWLRVSVPDVKKYFTGYLERSRVIGGNEFPSPALAVSSLTQMHFHRSAWDGELMCTVLSALGFVDAREIEFGEGADARLLKDQAAKRFESLYVGARKPPQARELQ